MAITKTFINSTANRLVMEEESKELAPILELMIANNIVSRKLIKMEFNIDYKTIARLVKKKETVSLATIRKLNFVIAYYLNEERKAMTKLKDWDAEKKNREKILAHLEEVYKSFYGFQATFALKMVRKGVDLRHFANQ